MAAVDPAEISTAQCDFPPMVSSPPSPLAHAPSEVASTLSRAVEILERVARAERPIALADLIEQSGLAKSTVHRVLAQLERELLVQREPDGKRYTAGPRLSAIALAAMRNSSDRAARHAVLQALVDEIGETCNFTTLDGNEIVYLDRVEAHWPLRMVLQPGSRVPLHCTASGKLFLALMPAPRRQRLLRAAPLKRFTDNTITNPQRLEQALKAIREEMVGTDEEEFLAGLSAIAVPVLDRRGRICATVAVHAPTARMNIPQARAHLPALRRAAAALAATCAYEDAAG
jgi:IclR family acetate operon transcriptional repressor